MNSDLVGKCPTSGTGLSDILFTYKMNELYDPKGLIKVTTLSCSTGKLYKMPPQRILFLGNRSDRLGFKPGLLWWRSNAIPHLCIPVYAKFVYNRVRTWPHATASKSCKVYSLPSQRYICARPTLQLTGLIAVLKLTANTWQHSSHDTLAYSSYRHQFTLSGVEHIWLSTFLLKKFGGPGGLNPEPLDP